MDHIVGRKCVHTVATSSTAVARTIDWTGVSPQCRKNVRVSWEGLNLWSQGTRKTKLGNDVYVRLLDLRKLHISCC